MEKAILQSESSLDIDQRLGTAASIDERLGGTVDLDERIGATNLDTRLKNLTAQSLDERIKALGPARLAKTRLQAKPDVSRRLMSRAIRTLNPVSRITLTSDERQRLRETHAAFLSQTRTTMNVAAAKTTTQPLRKPLSAMTSGELKDVEDAVIVANIAQRRNLNEQQKEELSARIFVRKYGVTKARVKRIIARIPIREVLMVMAAATLVTTLVGLGAFLIGLGSGISATSIATSTAVQGLSFVSGKLASNVAINTRMRNAVPFRRLRDNKWVRKLRERTGDVLPLQFLDATAADMAGALTSDAVRSVLTIATGGGLAGFLTEAAMSKAKTIAVQTGAKVGVKGTKVALNKGIDGVRKLGELGRGMWSTLAGVDKQMEIVAEDQATKDVTENSAGDPVEQMAEVLAAGSDIINELNPPPLEVVPDTAIDEKLQDKPAAVIRNTLRDYGEDVSLDEQMNLEKLRESIKQYKRQVMTARAMEKQAVKDSVAQTGSKVGVVAAAGLATAIVAGLYTGKLQNVALSVAQMSALQQVAYSSINSTIGINTLVSKAVHLTGEQLKRVEFLQAQIPGADKLRKTKYISELMKLLLGTYYMPQTLEAMSLKELRLAAARMNITDVHRMRATTLRRLINKQQDELFNVTYHGVLLGTTSVAANRVAAKATQFVVQQASQAVAAQYENARNKLKDWQEAREKAAKEQRAEERKARAEEREARAAQRRATRLARKAAERAEAGIDSDAAAQSAIDATLAAQTKAARAAERAATEAKAALRRAKRLLDRAARNAEIDAAAQQAIDETIRAQQAEIDKANEAFRQAVSQAQALAAGELVDQTPAALLATGVFDHLQKSLSDTAPDETMQGPALSPVMGPPALSPVMGPPSLDDVLGPELVDIVNDMFKDYELPTGVLTKMLTDTTVGFAANAIPGFGQIIDVYQKVASGYNMGTDLAQMGMLARNAQILLESAKGGFKDVSTLQDQLWKIQPAFRAPTVADVVDKAAEALGGSGEKVKGSEFLTGLLMTSTLNPGGVQEYLDGTVNNVLFGNGILADLTKPVVGVDTEALRSGFRELAGAAQGLADIYRAEGIDKLGGLRKGVVLGAAGIATTGAGAVLGKLTKTARNAMN